MTDTVNAPNQRQPSWLRLTLRRSQQEAVASSAMTATNDNFLNAFAVYLQASAAQMGWLTAIPQFFAAVWQLVSAWMGNHMSRKRLVIGVATLQAVIMLAMAVLALWRGFGGLASWQIPALITLAVGYFSCLNIIQPHWRAWMGALVPGRRRGLFFARRTRLTMISSLLVFILGGTLLSGSDATGLAWLGFALLFGVAAVGRFWSAQLMRSMHDPSNMPIASDAELWATLRQVGVALKEPTFRQYSFYVASMQGMVAISAPFFAVYMLRDLQFSYLQFSLNNIASVATQFLLLSSWGRFSDRFGNRATMIICSCLIPVLPLLWLVSPNFYYLLLVQVLSGLAWSGYTLSTGNYLYDIRPHQTNFAFYAAIQAAVSALAVFAGALLGGYVASQAPTLWNWLMPDWGWGSALFIVFLTSSLLRIAVAAYYLPRLHEPTLRKRPQVLQVIFRVARISAISGVVLDWMSVTRKNDDK